MSGPVAPIGVENEQHKHKPNPYITNVGTGLFIGGLFGALQASWFRVPTEDILSSKSFRPGHGGTMLRNGLKWGGMLGSVALVYTAGQDFSNAMVGEGSLLNKPIVGLLTGLFLGVRTASAKVFFKSSAIVAAALFIMDQFPDLETIEKDVRRDAAAIRRARLEQYQREHGEKVEPVVTSHHH